jgi:hypothetical protein
MRVPQVTERIKEAPVQALRGVLAGIGQVLLFTDKLRNKKAPAPGDASGGVETATASATASASTEAPAAAETSVAAETSDAAEAASAAPAAAEDVAAAPAPAAAEAAAPAAAEAAATAETTATTPTVKTRRPRKARDLDKTGNVTILTGEGAPSAPAEAPAATEPSAEEAAEVAVETPTAAAELPMPTYDDLTVASIRARLRNLTAAQVATLAEYEKAHAARPEVITMFERRIAKLEAEG